MDKKAKVTTMTLNKFHALSGDADSDSDDEEAKEGGNRDRDRDRDGGAHNIYPTQPPTTGVHPHYNHSIPHRATADVFPDTGLARCRDNPGETVGQRGMRDLSGSDGVRPNELGARPIALCKQDIPRVHAKQ